MKNRIVLTFLSLVLAGMVTTAAYAEDVYVTKYGKKYHKEGSRFIKDKEVVKLDRLEAEEKGYAPSSEFEEGSTSKKDSKKVEKE